MNSNNGLQAAAEKRSRLFFVDHLRVALAILVVLHHVAIVYGASIPFYYMEPPLSDPLAYVVLLVFALLNQAWFMGAFFLLAGYFAPGSTDRKGPWAFVKGKLVRLGIPLVFYLFVINPIAETGFWLMPSDLTGITNPLTWKAYPKLIGLGPIWFVAMLLVFSLGYALWRALTKNRATSSAEKPSAPSYLGVGLFVLALALASYLMRMAIPIGKSLFEFPTLAYLPQYLSFFVIGTVAYRRNWFRTLPSAMGVVGLVAALVAGVVLFPLGFSGQLFKIDLGGLNNAMGNGHWQSAVYALFDSIFSIGLCLGAIVVFRRFANRESRFGGFLARHSYAVYLLHIPVVVYLGYAMRGIQLSNLLKFGLASLVMVPASFVVAWLVRKVPLVSRVL
jgi:peptidoglycan/LPS O-acetylase OafA/YrhL